MPCRQNVQAMKTTILLTAFLLSYSLAADGQDDSVYFEMGLPMVIEDTATGYPYKDIEPKDQFKKLLPGDIPHRLYESLTTNEQYEGWEKFPVYLDKNTGLYIVRTSRGKNIWTFGMNGRGKPVTVMIETSKDSLDQQ